MGARASTPAPVAVRTTTDDAASLRAALPPLEINERNNVAINDYQLINKALALQGNRMDDMYVGRMPLVGWQYTRWLIFGCCATETEMLAAMVHPQYVPYTELWSYHRVDAPFPVWVNYPHFGTGLATHFQVEYAATRVMVYLCVQAFMPFGPVEGRPFHDGRTYRVVADWCIRLPAAVMSVRPAFGDVVLSLASGVVSSLELARFISPAGTGFERTLDIARTFLMHDEPQAAMFVVGLRPANVFRPLEAADAGGAAGGGGGGAQSGVAQTTTVRVARPGAAPVGRAISMHAGMGVAGT